MKTREQLLQDIGEAVREYMKDCDKHNCIEVYGKAKVLNDCNFNPRVINSLQALAEFEYEQLKDEK